MHHDIWDYDCPSPTVLFDVMLPNGTQRKAIAESCKTGWTYILDRDDRRPIPAIDRIPEKKVGQVKANNTWPTQPQPDGRRVVCAVSAGERLEGKKAPDGKPFKVGCIWTPIDFEQFTVISPSAAAAPTGRR